MYEAGDPQATSQIQINGTFLIDSFKAYVDDALVDDALAYKEGRGWVDSVQIKVPVGVHKIKLTYMKSIPVHPFYNRHSTATLGEFHGFFDSGKYVINISMGKTWQFWVDYIVEPPRRL